ncbi:MAG TPA: hypothetical protein EYO60_10740 [Candidatus Lambdaproteobacteria bacterium]|nr:hypothetical protein [Candidatus Lambdaproteobacteria bacterium]
MTLSSKQEKVLWQVWQYFFVRPNNRSLRDKLGLNNNSRVLMIGTEGVTDSEIFTRILKGN